MKQKFRNLCIYRLPPDWAMTADQLATALAAVPLNPCGPLELASRGWVAAYHADQLIHVVDGHWLIRLGVEEKTLPTAALEREVAKRAATIAAEEQRPVGRRELRKLRESIADELLPHVLPRPRSTVCWINPKARWLVLDTAATGRADEFVEVLQRTLGGLALRSLQTQIAPSAAMTGWLANADAPDNFSIDQDLELRSPVGNKAVVRYVRHALEGAEIREHIAQGKLATRLGMTWNSRVSFVLTDKLALKGISFLDIVAEEAEQSAETAAEQLDIDLILMAGEFCRLFADLILALGGEQATAHAATSTSAGEAPRPVAVLAEAEAA